MIGAIIGDIVGSPYEHGFNRNASVPSPDFQLFNDKSRFTDDTVLTCATAFALLDSSGAPYKYRFAKKYREWALNYPDRGYGGRFKQWVAAPKMQVLDSYANGCMMRCSPIGMFYSDKELALKRALDSIQFTHNSPESARGIQSIVSAIHMALHGATKEEIASHVQIEYGHMLNLTLAELRSRASKDIRCNLSAPQALVCFMKSTDYETAIRYAVFTDGDTDTTAAIAGAISEAYYGVDSIPQFMIDEAVKRLNPKMISTINQFYEVAECVNPKMKKFQIA